MNDDTMTPERLAGLRREAEKWPRDYYLSFINVGEFLALIDAAGAAQASESALRAALEKFAGLGAGIEIDGVDIGEYAARVLADPASRPGNPT